MRSAFFIPILLFLASCGMGSRASLNPANQTIIIDPQRACASLPVGSLCGGGKYIGEVAGTKYVATQAGCTNSTTPTCDDVLDTELFEWENGFGLQPALEYCRDMDYNGHSDWVLPSDQVLIEMYNQQLVIGGFVLGNYWSREQYYYDEFYAVDLNDGSYTYWWETNTFNVRCVRVSPI